jgi:hypothetical protein
MSRHLLTALPQFEGCEVVVGWDADSGTFFAYVLDMQASVAEKDPWLVSVGGGPLEIRDPHEAIDAVRPYATIPDELVDELAEEAAASPGPVRPQLGPGGLDVDRLAVLDGGHGADPVMPAASPGVTAAEGSADR